jgi:hypothetical protein
MMVKRMTFEPSGRTSTVWASAVAAARPREKTLMFPTARMRPVSGQRAVVRYSPAS